MLTISEPLPSALILGQDGAALRHDLTGTGGWWFSAAEPEALSIGPGGAASGWTATLAPDRPAGTDGASALPVGPNSGGSRPGEDAGHPALTFTTGQNGGLTVPSALADGGTFTLAVIWTAPAGEDARTLAAIQAQGSGNLLFLSVNDGTITCKDRNGTIGATLALPPAPTPGGFRLICVSLDGAALWLSCEGKTVMADGQRPGLDGPADLFIGCRNQRNGLLKTLGAARIADVILLGGRNILGGTAPDDARLMAALRRYANWRY